MNLTGIQNKREVDLDAYFMGFTPNVVSERRARPLHAPHVSELGTRDMG